MRERLDSMGIGLRTVDDLNRLHETDSRARAFVVGVICKALNDGQMMGTLATLEARLGSHSPYVAALQKSAVAPMGTISGELRPFGNAFLRLVSSRSAFESLGLPKVPPHTRIALANGGDLAVTWVDEAEAIPVGRVPVDFESLTPRKLALLIVLTSELVQSTSGEATGTVERILTQSVASSTDAVAFDPNTAGSLTAGAPEVTSTGDLGDGIAAVLAELSGGVASRPALVLGAAAARLLVFSGDDIFKDVALAGPGTLAGIPTFTSPSRAIANLVVGIDRDGVLVADGGIDIATAGHATLQMDDAPDNPASAGTVTVSLWQQNLVSLRALRYLAWVKRDDAVAYATFATQSP